MSRRGENIRKREDGRWEGRYKIGINENGSAKYSSVYGRTYSECKSKLENKKISTFAGIKTNSVRLRFKDVLFLWLSINKIRIKKSTETKYKNMIETHILPELGNIFVSDLNSNIINIYLDKKLKNGKVSGKGGLSPSYVKTIAIIIESALKYAQNEGYCLPLNSPILKPSIKKKELKILTPDTQVLFEKILLTDIDETKLGIFIVLQTGLRLGEICALVWDDIDFESKTINVNNTITRVRCDKGERKSKLIIDTAKTESSIRKIPISSALLPILIRCIWAVTQKNEKRYIKGEITTTAVFSIITFVAAFIQGLTLNSFVSSVNEVFNDIDGYRFEIISLESSIPWLFIASIIGLIFAAILFVGGKNDPNTVEQKEISVTETENKEERIKKEIEEKTDDWIKQNTVLHEDDQDTWLCPMCARILPNDIISCPCGYDKYGKNLKV